MAKFLIFGASTVFGTIGWWLGDFIGMDFAFFLSTVGSFAGLVLGWKWFAASFS